VNHHHPGPQRPTWSQHAESIAWAASHRSEDPYCKVGACVLNARGVVLGVGYNGTAPGIDIDWLDRDARRPYVIHAEANALRYTTPELAEGGLMAVTHFPCTACVLLASSYGIRMVAWTAPPDWDRYPADLTLRVAARLGVDVRNQQEMK
jgi:dCMP deaminase